MPADRRFIPARALFFLIMGIMGALLAALVAPAGATSAAPTAIFTVNGSGDGADANPGDGLCDVQPATAGEQCTLRAAIEEANALPGADQIRFGNTPRTIRPNSALPAISEQVTINGVNANDGACPTDSAAANLLITLDGSNTTATSGLTVNTGAADSVIKGLAIVNWQGQPGNGAGLTVNANRVRVECNHIGIAADGVTAAPNTYGIVTSGNNVTIGGATANERNVISGNDVWGIRINGGAQTILGNYIGTDAAGTGDVGNGIGIIGNLNGLGSATVGAAGQGNVIAFNGSGINGQTIPIAARYNSLFANGTGIDSLDSDADFDYVDATGQITIDFARYDGSFPATIDLYGNDVCNVNGGEGKTHFATFDVAAPTDTIRMQVGPGTFDAPFAAFTVTAAGVTAAGDTYEFSNCLPVQPALRVNRAGDLPDLLPGDGICDTQAAAGVQCGLRAAIEEINALGRSVPTYLNFDIALPATLVPASALPALNAPVAIDARDPDAADCAPRLQIDGQNAGATAAGLTLGNAADGSSLAGLAIVNFGGDGLRVRGDDTLIECVYIGLARDGTTAGGNGGHGILRPAGDALSVDVTTIVHNAGDGLNATTTGAVAVTRSAIGVYLDPVSFDYIAGGNGGHGILAVGPLDVTNSTIGANDGSGIVSSGVLHVNDSGIGGVRFGNTPLGNGGSGIVAAVDTTFLSVIEDSDIAFNGAAGVAVLNSRDNLGLVANRIHTNGGLGIDLNNDGVTSNDSVPDADGGGNNRQNFALITGVAPAGETISVTLESAPNTDFVVDFFGSDVCDPSGHGEGQRWLSAAVLRTNASGVVSAVLTNTNVVVNDYVTATASRYSTTTFNRWDTSEFSPCVRAVERFVINSTADDGDSDPNDGVCRTAGGVCTLRAAIEQLNALAASELRYLTFATPGMTIAPQTALPVLLRPVVFELAAVGRAPAAAAAPIATLDGSALASGNLLHLAAGSDGSSVSGLQLINAPAAGLVIDSHSNVVQGNWIGTDDLGSALGNGGNGVTVNGDGNQIGDNVIAHNGAAGIAVGSGGQDNTLSGNSLDANGGLAIDLNADGVSANDAGDGDGGGNRRQNYPVLSAADATTVDGTLSSRANRSYQIELYGVTACDPSGHGEAAIYLGSDSVTTNGSGQATFSIATDDGVCAPYVTATATDLTTGDTSELSACFAVPQQPPTAVALGGAAADWSNLANLTNLLAGLALLLLLTLLALRTRRRAVLLLALLLLGALVATFSVAPPAAAVVAPPVTCGDAFIPDGTLTNGAALSDDSGLVVATFSQTLSAPLPMMLQTLAAPSPAYDGVGTPVGPSYRVRPAADVSTPAGAPLVIGVPLPDGVAGDDVLVALFSNDPTIPDAQGGSFWGETLTHYDADAGLMLITLRRLPAGGVVLTLATAPTFDPLPTVAPRAAPRAPEAIAFEPNCPAGCSLTVKAAIALELLNAYNDFVGTHGFNRPALSNYTLALNPSGNGWLPQINLGDVYNGVLINDPAHCFTTDAAGNRNEYAGIYHPGTQVLEICTLSATISDDVRDTIRHELFHAVQHAYPAIHQFPDWDQAWVMEGTASLAGSSIGGLHRFPGWEVRDVTDALIQTYPVPSGLIAYEGQDFWFYILDAYGQPLGYLEQIFAGGIEPADVNAAVGNLPDLYFEWVRNQVFEHHNDNDGTLTQACDVLTRLDDLARDHDIVALDAETTRLEVPLMLDPLDSGLVIIDVLPELADGATVTVETLAGGAATHYVVWSRVADGLACRNVADGARAFDTLAAGDDLYVVVANPALAGGAAGFVVVVTVNGGGG